MDHITLSLNGQPREFARGLSVGQLLQQLELQGKRLAVEHNGDILPRSQFDSVLLQLVQADRSVKAPFVCRSQGSQMS